MLSSALQCKKLPHNTGNVLTLLELTIPDDDDAGGGAALDAAIELDVLPQLCACLDPPQVRVRVRVRASPSPNPS